MKMTDLAKKGGASGGGYATADMLPPITPSMHMATKRYLLVLTASMMASSCCNAPSKLMPTLCVGNASGTCVGLLLDNRKPLGGFIAHGNEVVWKIVEIVDTHAPGVFEYKADYSDAPYMRGRIALTWSYPGYAPECRVTSDRADGEDIFDGLLLPIASGWSINIQSPGDIR